MPLVIGSALVSRRAAEPEERTTTAGRMDADRGSCPGNMRLKPRLQRHTVRLRGHQRRPRCQSRGPAPRLHERGESGKGAFVGVLLGVYPPPTAEGSWPGVGG